MNMKQSCKALICAIEGELDGRHCTQEQAAAILDHALPSLTEALARAQSELAEAVGLLRYSQEIARLFDDEHTAEVGRFLSRHAQAEQHPPRVTEDQIKALAEAQQMLDDVAVSREQRAERLGIAQAEQQEVFRTCSDERPCVNCFANNGHCLGPNPQEAQGAQAGDELIRKVAVALARSPEITPDEARRVRAALATQPVAGEPVAFAGKTVADRLDQMADAQPSGSSAQSDLYAAATVWRKHLAPPAAAPVAAGEPVATIMLKRSLGGPSVGVVRFDADQLPDGVLVDVFAAPPAAAHGDEAVRIDARLLELYQAPFRFDERGGYIWDSQNNMVADNHVEGDQAMRVRGWGRLSYRQDGEEVQYLMGQAMADALTARWNAAMRAQGDGEVL